MRAKLLQKNANAEIKPISTTHGKSYTAQASYGNVTIIPPYHPAAAIYNQKLKSVLKEDFKIIKKYV